MKKLFRRKTIAEDGLPEVWLQVIHRAALKETIIWFAVLLILAIGIYLLWK